jgi:hypothetical protein
MRKQSKTDPTAIEDLDLSLLQFERDRLALEKYGGTPVEPPPPSYPPANGCQPGSGVTDDEDYHVEAFVRAREWFGTIDRWAYALERAKDEAKRNMVLHDGYALLQALGRMKQQPANPMIRGQSHVAAHTVYDELKLRLSEASRASH